jgi:hypothetical protein
VDVLQVSQDESGRKETWYREQGTGHIFLLIEDRGQDEFRWDRVDQTQADVALGKAPIN